MTTNFAFAGFRHNHILDVYQRVAARSDLRIVGACESDASVRENLTRQGTVKLTHDSFDRMLADTDCHIVAVGDVYARRGALLVKALQAGKHVISDKPICTSIEELDQIEKLAKDKKLIVGCQLDLRSSGNLRQARELIRQGQIGEVHTVSFSGQHPLLYGTRPSWYFQPGQQGGTINDIAIHAFDAIPWITGRTIKEVVAARVWNTKAKETPFFQDGAQIMLRLDNDGGVLGDVSYLAPDGCGYALPHYWRFVIHGALGILEFNYGQPGLMLARSDDKAPQQIDKAPDAPGEYLQDFLAQIAGRPQAANLKMADVFSASRIALSAQQKADLLFHA